MWPDLWTFLFIPSLCILLLRQSPFTKTSLLEHCIMVQHYCLSPHHLIGHHLHSVNNERGGYIHFVSFYQLMLLKGHLPSLLLFTIYLIPKPDIIAHCDIQLLVYWLPCASILFCITSSFVCVCAALLSCQQHSLNYKIWCLQLISLSSQISQNSLY